MADDEYEILPHQLLADLKGEVEALKKKLTQPDSKSEELILEIESLKDSIHELTDIFQKAMEETKEQDVFRMLQTMNDKIDTLNSQDETIAKGMIAISDKVDDFVSKASSGPSAPSGNVRHDLSAPGMPGRTAPMPMMPQMESYPSSDFETGLGGRLDFPPPPPSSGGRRRTGLFR